MFNSCSELIQDLRRLLDTLDEICEHGHYFRKICLEVREGLNAEEQELCKQLRDHSIACASGSYGSLIRNLAAVAVHYSQLQRLLLLLYCTKKYH